MTVVETFRSTDSGDERRRDNRAQVGESSSADGQGARRVGDGVVDSIIREAEFGLDVAYVQAKRLDPNEGVRLSGVRDFVGGLEGPSGLSHFGNFVRWKLAPGTCRSRNIKRVIPSIMGSGALRAIQAGVVNRMLRRRRSIDCLRRGRTRSEPHFWRHRGLSPRPWRP